MPIQTLLDVPAKAVSAKDIELLGAYPAKGRPYGMALIAYPHGEGFTVSTSQMRNPSESDRAAFLGHVRTEGFSEGFVNLVSDATGKGADLIRIGQVGVTEERLSTILDLSTGHVTHADSKIPAGCPSSAKASDGPVFAHPYEYGWTVPASVMANEGFDGLGLSEGFAKVIEHARVQGAEMVRLDQDADFEPGLMAFDWERGVAPYDPELYGDSQEAAEAAGAGPTP